jgi:hypothetical protein
MEKYRLLTLVLMTEAVLTGCAGSGGLAKPTTPPSRSADDPALAAPVCKPIQRVHVTAVTPGSAGSPSTITVSAGDACIDSGSGLVVWAFKGVSGYVFVLDTVRLKLDQPPGLIAGVVSNNKAKYFAIFDNDSAVTWAYNLKFTSADGRQTWICDPTINNRGVPLIPAVGESTINCSVSVGP